MSGATGLGAVASNRWSAGAPRLAFSAHADQAGLLVWLRRSPRPPRQVFVTHGEAVPADTLRRAIQDALGYSASVPEYLDSAELA